MPVSWGRHISKYFSRKEMNTCGQESEDRVKTTVYGFQTPQSRAATFRDIFIEEWAWAMFKCLVGKCGTEEENFKRKAAF